MVCALIVVQMKKKMIVMRKKKMMQTTMKTMKTMKTMRYALAAGNRSLQEPVRPCVCLVDE